MKIESRKLSEIIPYHKNPRKNAEAVAAVAESIRQFGVRQPIVVDDAGVIIIGDTRRRAALQLVGVAQEYREQNEAPTLASFLQEVSLVSDQDTLADRSSQVTLMTIHNATGSAVIVEVQHIAVDMYQTVAKPITVPPPMLTMVPATPESRRTTSASSKDYKSND